MKKLLQDFKGYYTGLIIGPIFKLSEAVMELFIPLLMANIIDKGIANSDVPYIVKNGILMLLLGALGLVFALICQYSASVVAHGYGKALRERLFKHAFILNEADCRRIGSAALITRLTNDVNQMQTGINMFIRLAIRAPYLAIGSIVMALILDFKLGLIFIVSTPLILLVLYFITKLSVPSYVRIQKKQDIISRLVSEMMLGARVIRAFSRQSLEEKEFGEAGDDLSEATIRVGKLSALLSPITTIIVNIAIIVIVWLGAGFAFSGSIEPGKILALVNYMTQTLLALVVLANILVVFSKAIASSKRVADFLEAKPSFTAPNKLTEAKTNQYAIAFDNITFSYQGNEPALTNINFAIQAGETMGVIGGTGCGKTTLARLALHFYEASSGKISVNGINVKDYPNQALHSQVSYVPQSAALFSGTIRNNLLVANENAADDDLWNALRIAQGYDFVRKLENELDTVLTEGGKNLSGGQRQRLCIARAIVSPSDIIILDDASSALDFATDAALRSALRQELSQKAIIMITQRAAAIKNANKILVLDDGEQAGLGTHEELLKICEPYKEICLSQGLVAEGTI